jgi:hypothetical protein
MSDTTSERIPIRNESIELVRLPGGEFEMEHRPDRRAFFAWSEKSVGVAS